MYFDIACRKTVKQIPKGNSKKCIPKKALKQMCFDVATQKSGQRDVF